MKKLTAFVLALAMMFAMPGAMPAFADAGDVVALQSQLSELSDKIMKLERQLRSVESKAGSSGSAYVPSGGGGGLVSAAENINMGGYVDVQWNNNFRQPDTTGAGGTNVGRIFDTEDGSFAVNAAELYFENPAEAVGESGFRIDLMFGEDAAVVNADGTITDTAGATHTDKVDLQQAYIEYIANMPFGGNSIVGDTVKIQAGRFATLAGLEVIESPDNWNISRSFTFGLAIPFTHTGVRTNFSMFNDYFDAYVGLNNGWDAPIDNNDYKTFELGLGYSPMDSVSVFHAMYIGAETAGSNADKRFLLTNVITYDATDKLSFMGEFNYGTDDNDATAGVNANARSDNDWMGLVGYTKYQFSDKFSVAYRAELFRDDTANRSGISVDGLFEQTLTAQYDLTDNLISRLEFRHDKANDDRPFDAGEDTSQTTIGGQLLYII